MRLARRPFLRLAAAAGALAALPVAADQIEAEADLKPGDYTWHPERSPQGPVAILVSLPEQLVHVYRNGLRIAVSTASSGKPGHETPTGVFVILQKDKHHHSSKYDDAAMPNSERLTWDGIALHAGGLPGYPSSHGCVHLPLDFSAKLYGITHIATPVIIAGSLSDPWTLVHPGLVLSEYAEGEFDEVLASLKDEAPPADWIAGEVQPIVSVVVSSLDRRMIMLRDGLLIGEGPLRSDGQPFGSQVFVLEGADQDARGLRWTAYTHAAAPGAALPQDPAVLQRITGDAAFVALLRDMMHPGMILVLTDLPLAPDTRSGTDFVILS